MNYQDLQNKIIELIQHDKALHFMFGFFLYVLSNVFLSDIHSLIIVFIIAIAKETRDEIAYNGGDWKDILFTVIPAITIFILNSIKPLLN